jgi:glycosyltransferase 2 family protein
LQVFVRIARVVASWKLPGIEIAERGRTAGRMLSRPWVRMSLTALLLGAALALFPGHRVLNAVRSVDLRLVVAALPAYLAIQTLAAAKWHLLVKRAGAGLGVWQSLECCFGGTFGMLALPSAVGADAVSVTLAMARARSRAGVLSGAFLSRALDMVAMALMVSVFAVFVPQGLQGQGARMATAMWVGGAVAIGALVAGAVLLPRWRWKAIGRLMERHRAALEPIRRPRLVALPFAMSVGTQFSFSLLSYAIGRACGVEVGLGVWLFAWTLAKLVILLPFTVAGIGARELALAALLAPFGVPTATAIATGLVWDVVAVVGILSSGVVWKVLGWRNRRFDRG